MALKHHYTVTACTRAIRAAGKDGKRVYLQAEVRGVDNTATVNVSAAEIVKLLDPQYRNGWEVVQVICGDGESVFTLCARN